jgi:hypothetical protein
MENLQSTAQLVRKIALLTLLGFLVIFLAGPVFTVIGVILPFALVGFLVWLPFQLFIVRKGIDMPSLQRAGEKGRHVVLGVPLRLAAVVKKVVRTIFAVPLWIIGRIFAGVVFILRTVFGLIGFVLGLVLPTLAGAILGAVLGAIGGMQHQDLEYRVPAGAVIGASIGLLVGATRSRSPKKVIVVRPTPEVIQHA